MDHLKSDECGGEGEGRGGKFSVYTIMFFFHRDKHEYFYSGAETSFLLLSLFCENIHIIS